MLDINKYADAALRKEADIKKLEEKLEAQKRICDQIQQNLTQAMNTQSQNEVQAKHDFEDAILLQKRQKYLNKIAELQDKKNNLEKQYNEDIEALNSTSMDNSYVVKELEEVYESLLKTAEGFYGVPREAIVENIDIVPASYSIEQFNEISEQYDNSSFLNLLEKLLSNLGSVLDSLDKYSFVLAIVFILLIVLAPYLLAIALTTVGALTFLYSGTLIKYLEAAKYLSEDADNTVAKLDAEYNEFCLEKKKTLKADFDKAAQDVDRELAEEHTALQQVALDPSETFDSAHFLSEYAAELKMLQGELQKNKQECILIEEDIAKENANLLTIKQDLTNAFNSVKDMYMSAEPSDSIKYDFKLLIDLDMSDYSVSAYDIGDQNCLFLYKNDFDMTSLITLILYQIRSQVDPHCLAITVFDTMFLGTYLQKFLPKEDNLKSTFVLKTDAQAIKNEYIKLLQSMINNSQTINSDSQNITEYNQHMKSINASMIPYHPIVDFTNDSLDDSTVKILKNGRKYGYYVMKFVSYDDIISGNLELELDLFQRVYLATDKLQPRSATFIKRQIVAK